MRSKSIKISVIDTGVGNLKSVENALALIHGCDVNVTNKPEIVASSECVILPGVGAFDDYMQRLHTLNLVEVLKMKAFCEHTPILGICVGMQVFFGYSPEGFGMEGLGWLQGDVKKLLKKEGVSIPHIGWNEVTLKTPDDPLFNKIPRKVDFYFLHSFAIDCPQDLVIASADYAQPISAVVKHKNIVGFQFHPERSGVYGAKLIENFVNEAKAGNNA